MGLRPNAKICKRESFDTDGTWHMIYGSFLFNGLQHQVQEQCLQLRHWFFLFFLGITWGKWGRVSGVYPSCIWLKTGTPQMTGQLIAWPYVGLSGFDSLLKDTSALIVSWHLSLQPKHLPNLAWAEKHLVLAPVLYSLRCYHTMVMLSCLNFARWWCVSGCVLVYVENITVSLCMCPFVYSLFFVNRTK